MVPRLYRCTYTIKKKSIMLQRKKATNSPTKMMLNGTCSSPNLKKIDTWTRFMCANVAWSPTRKLPINQNQNRLLISNRHIPGQIRSPSIWWHLSAAKQRLEHLMASNLIKRNQIKPCFIIIRFAEVNSSCQPNPETRVECQNIFNHNLIKLFTGNKVVLLIYDLNSLWSK